jgi:hypothetical protein
MIRIESKNIKKPSDCNVASREILASGEKNRTKIIKIANLIDTHSDSANTVEKYIASIYDSYHLD